MNVCNENNAYTIVILFSVAVLVPSRYRFVIALSVRLLPHTRVHMSPRQAPQRQKQNCTYALVTSESGKLSTTTTPALLPSVTTTLRHCVALLVAAVVAFVGYATHGFGFAPPRQAAYSVGTAGQGFVE